MRNFSMFLLLVVGLSATLYFMIDSSNRQSGRKCDLVLPEIVAAGWLNGRPPSRESLEGRVVVIEAWATWCVPCRKIAPVVAAVHEKYSPNGVVFMSLTDEGSAYVPAIKAYLRDTGGTWLTGYGRSTLLKLGNDAIPTVWVFGRDGRLVWTGHPGERGTFESAITTALQPLQAQRAG